MDLNQFNVSVILILMTVLVFSFTCLLNRGFMFLNQRQEIKYIDFADENEKESKELKSEIDPQWKVDLMVISARSNSHFSTVMHYVAWKDCSKDFLETPTPPPENNTMF